MRETATRLEPQPSDADRARFAERRLRGFKLHLAGFSIIATAVIVIGILADPGATWIVIPPVAWGGVLALHAAYAMGLFDVFRRGRGD